MSTTQKSRRSPWIEWAFKALLVLLGLVAQQEAQGNPYVLVPIPASLVVLAILGLRRSGTMVQRLVVRVAGGVAEFGSDYGLGVGFAIVIANIGDSVRWVLLGVFFSLAVLMISLGDFARNVGAERPKLSTRVAPAHIG